MNTVAIIQARMLSTRLPGKVLKPIAGKALLEYVVTRLHKSKCLDNIIVATSSIKADAAIVKWCEDNNYKSYKGNHLNVLDRYYKCAKSVKADIVVRVTADCPLIDSLLVDHGVKLLRKNRCDYVSNTIERTYPRGFDFEIFTFTALAKMQKNAHYKYELEHVTPYIWKSHPKLFSIQQVKQNANKSKYRVTVDTPEDFHLMEILINKFSAANKSCEGITAILDQNPDLWKINHKVQQKII